MTESCESKKKKKTEGFRLERSKCSVPSDIQLKMIGYWASK
jgi:hypothetical protein